MPAVKTGNGPWGEALKYWLPKRNMRNADLARLTGIEENTISKMARGFHTTTRKLEVVANALNVPLEEILVSPERQRANESLEIKIRDAVSAALRQTDPRHGARGHDELQTAIEAQAQEDESRTALEKKMRAVRKRKHRK